MQLRLLPHRRGVLPEIRTQIQKLGGKNLEERQEGEYGDAEGVEDAFGRSGGVGASDCKGATARVSEESGGRDGDSGDDQWPVEERRGMLGVCWWRRGGAGEG